MLSDIAPFLRELAYRRSLTSDQARAALNTIGSEDRITDATNSDGYYFLALTFGLMAKGPTADELYGFVLSLSDQSVKFETTLAAEQLIDVSGTGGDSIKTFNIGTAASVVIAAGGGFVAKQATRGYTGFTGSADAFRELGLDPNLIKREDVARCLEEVGLVAFYTPAFSVGFRNRIDFLTKLTNIGLTYPTPWHLVSWVYSPFPLGARLYGVFDKQYVPVLAQLFAKLGYKRALVVHGLDGLDEMSIVGETAVAELKDGSISEYVVSPEQYGLERAGPADIETLPTELFRELRDPITTDTRKRELEALGRTKNIGDFFRVLYGLETGPKRDIVLMNAGAGLYLCGKTTDIASGVSLAREVIESGRAKEKVRQLAKACDGMKTLRETETRLQL